MFQNVVVVESFLLSDNIKCIGIIVRRIDCHNLTTRERCTTSINCPTSIERNIYHSTMIPMSKYEAIDYVSEDLIPPQWWLIISNKRDKCNLYPLSKYMLRYHLYSQHMWFIIIYYCYIRYYINIPLQYIQCIVITPSRYQYYLLEGARRVNFPRKYFVTEFESSLHLFYK